MNPACTKCRTAMKTFDDAGVDYTTRRYLHDLPTPQEIEDVVARLGIEPWDLARPKEAQEHGVDQLPRNAEHRRDWVEALAALPKLIQRPIITADDGTTVIGRTPEALQEVLAHQRG